MDASVRACVSSVFPRRRLADTVTGVRGCRRAHERTRGELNGRPNSTSWGSLVRYRHRPFTAKQDCGHRMAEPPELCGFCQMSDVGCPGAVPGSRQTGQRRKLGRCERRPRRASRTRLKGANIAVALSTRCSSVVALDPTTQPRHKNRVFGQRLAGPMISILQPGLPRYGVRAAGTRIGHGTA
jgi:hypothetical protein